MKKTVLAFLAIMSLSAFGNTEVINLDTCKNTFEEEVLTSSIIDFHVEILVNIGCQNSSNTCQFQHPQNDIHRIGGLVTLKPGETFTAANGKTFTCKF